MEHTLYFMQEELYRDYDVSSPPEHSGGIPVYPPNLHPWSPGVVSNLCYSMYIHMYMCVCLYCINIVLIG